MCKVIEYYNPQCGHAFRYRLDNRCQDGFSYAARSCKGDGNQVIGYRPFPGHRVCEACKDDALEIPDQSHHLCADEIQACSEEGLWSGFATTEAWQEELRHERIRHLNVVIALRQHENFEDAEEEQCNDETEGDWDSEVGQGADEQHHCVLEEGSQGDDGSVFFSSKETQRDIGWQEHSTEDEDDAENDEDVADGPDQWGFTHSDRELNNERFVEWLLADHGEVDTVDVCDSPDVDTKDGWDSAAEADVEDNCDTSEAELEGPFRVWDEEIDHDWEDEDSESEEDIL